MPLIVSTTRSSQARRRAQPLLVFSDGSALDGAVVDEIVDIVEDNLNIEIASEQPGILGSAMIKGEATEIIDVAHYLPLAFADWFRGRDAQVAAVSRSSLLVDDFGLLPQHADPGAECRRI